MSIATASVRAFGSTAIVAVTDPSALRDTKRTLVRDLRRLDLACSRFRIDSELVALNTAGGVPVKASALLREHVRVALDTATSTDGLVDPTIGRSMRIAGYDRNFIHLQLRDGRLVRPGFEPAGRWRDVEIDEAAGTVRVPAGVELDLGATAKAHAADSIAAVAARATGAGVLVSIGGDIATGGLAPSGGWVIGIDDDHTTPGGEVTARVSVSSGGLASSGIRVRRWRTAAGELHHILDPRTGHPAGSAWSTVTVAAATCAGANAASTAAIVLGEAAPEWLAAQRLPARLQREDGRAVAVGGWPEEAA